MSDLCEVCGKRDAKFLVYIEGAKLMTCPSCAYGGKILLSLDGESPLDSNTILNISKNYKRIPRAFRDAESVVDNYGSIIRDARRNKGMKREEVGKEINEKESYLEHIEKEKTVPPLKVLKKLEKFFNIKLIEKTSSDEITRENIKNTRSRGMTLADVLAFQKEHKKKNK